MWVSRIRGMWALNGWGGGYTEDLFSGINFHERYFALRKRSTNFGAKEKTKMGMGETRRIHRRCAPLCLPSMFLRENTLERLTHRTNDIKIMSMDRYFSLT